MAKGSINKEELLLQSFDILKNNLEGNSDKIQEIIAKIAKSNTSLSIDMWRYVLVNGEAIIKRNGYSFTAGMLYSLKRTIGNEEVITVLNENEEILECVFGKSNSISSSYIWDALKFGYIELAEKMYSLVKKNRYKDDSLAEIVEEICDSFASEFDYIHDVDDDDNDNYDDSIEDRERANQVASVLLKWVGNIRDKEAKARITVSLIDYV
ncbi:hypothetical protein [Ammoniphilus sp. CFH 90114]|uniref:hypothetical protein n=1 Tax=Ammoniphilus sp. CFH 90114 TaxID=2493665 RepID=UPI00100F8CBC|nr:hypothetical protein [Ammoniphilus sp. CFH 90114]RXT14875.1 hypothetical protein EIZ39_01290 [Ammoniphilus sp. CFH 90114]